MIPNDGLCIVGAVNELGWIDGTAQPAWTDGWCGWMSLKDGDLRLGEGVDVGELKGGVDELDSWLPPAGSQVRRLEVDGMWKSELMCQIR